MYCKKITAALLCLLLLLSLAGCGGSGNGIHSFSAGLPNRELALCCREGDPLLELLRAGLRVRTADGTAASLAQKWLGEDISSIKGDPNALEAMEIPEGRVLLLGYDPSAMPFSGTDEAGEAQGYEIELARSVCELLGWELRALPIDGDKVSVELASGEVDCAWGGIDLGSASGVAGFAYMETEYVFATLGRENVRSLKALKDKAVSYPQFAQRAAAALELEANTAVAAKLADTAACFAAMEAGRCSAVLTDSISAAWAGR